MLQCKKRRCAPSNPDTRALKDGNLCLKRTVWAIYYFFFFLFFRCTGASPVIGDTPPIACSSLASLPAKLTTTKARLKFIPTRHSSVSPTTASCLYACHFAPNQVGIGASCAISTNWPANSRCLTTSIATMAQQPLPTSAQPTDIYGGGSFVTVWAGRIDALHGDWK